MVKAKYGVNICGNYTQYLKTHYRSLVRHIPENVIVSEKII